MTRVLFGVAQTKKDLKEEPKEPVCSVGGMGCGDIAPRGQVVAKDQEVEATPEEVEG